MYRIKCKSACCSSVCNVLLKWIDDPRHCGNPLSANGMEVLHCCPKFKNSMCRPGYKARIDDEQKDNVHIVFCADPGQDLENGSFIFLLSIV